MSTEDNQNETVNQNQIVPFIYDESPLRVVLDDKSSTPWFVAKDVCSILELADVSMSIRNLDDDEKLIQTLFVSGQNREVWTVSEPGLYTLIFRSKKPAAKTFRRWVTHEVLPTLRRTGQFTVNEDIIADTRAMIREFAQLASALVNTVDRLDRRISALEEQETQIPNSTPNPADNLADTFFIKHLNTMKMVRPDVRNFLIEKTIIHPDAGTLLSWLYTMYEQWCYSNCHIPIGKIHFYNECRMALAGYSEIKPARGNKLYVTGIRLRDDKDF